MKHILILISLIFSISAFSQSYKNQSLVYTCDCSELVPFVSSIDDGLISSTQDVLIEGAGFTSSVSVVGFGFTVNSITIINGNELIVNVTTGTQGVYSLIISNECGETQSFLNVVDLICLVGGDNSAWENINNVIVGTGSIQRNAIGANGWSNGASFGGLSGDFELVFTVASLSVGNSALMIGASDVDINQNYNTIDHAIYLLKAGANSTRVYENGAFSWGTGTYTTGDIFTIRRIGTSIDYLKNGTSFHTSTSTIDPVIFDTSFYYSGSYSGTSIINNIELCEI